MKRSLFFVIVAAVLSAAAVRAEFLQIELSVFGMD